MAFVAGLWKNLYSIAKINSFSHNIFLLVGLVDDFVTFTEYKMNGCGELGIRQLDFGSSSVTNDDLVQVTSSLLFT